MRNKHHRGAGLLPAAVEEIKRLRAEWAALKDSDLLEVSLATIHQSADTFTRPKQESHLKTRSVNKRRSLEVLRGVVALVAVGSEPRALPLRAALAALGATVVPLWSPLVTHVVWSEGGDREARAQARASAAHVVSPLWVEACAAADRRVAEASFPAAARPSDLPSPGTLISLLKRAENNNLPFADLLPDKARITGKMDNPVATETSRDVESDDSAADTSEELSEDASRDTSDTSNDTKPGTSKEKPKIKSSTSTDDSSSSTSERGW